MKANQDSGLFFIVLSEKTVIAVVFGVVKDSDPLLIFTVKFNRVWGKILHLFEADAPDYDLLIVNYCLEQDAHFPI